MSTADFSRRELVKLPRLSPEVILLDMVMPVMDAP
jgi:chemotaxis response regulator CheB